MTFADLYLICFIVGFAMSLLTLVLGDLHFHLHLPFHMHIGAVDAPHVPHVGHAGHAGHAHAGGEMPAINFGTITAFLTWFGGIGYLLARFSSLMAAVALLLAIAGGFIGAAIVFFFVAKVLMKHDKSLDPADFEMVGVLGRVTSSIREGGTGEIVYTQDGTRHACGARAENSTALAKGVEVVITRYEKGIAYVRPWEEMNALAEFSK